MSELDRDLGDLEDEELVAALQSYRAEVVRLRADLAAAQQVIAAVHKAAGEWDWAGKVEAKTIFAALSADRADRAEGGGR